MYAKTRVDAVMLADAEFYIRAAYLDCNHHKIARSQNKDPPTERMSKRTCKHGTIQSLFARANGNSFRLKQILIDLRAR